MKFWADLDDALSLGTRTWGNHADGTTLLLMGCYQLRGEISRQVLSALPQQVVLEPETWSSPLVPLLDEELVADAPGHVAVLDRLFDLLLVSVIRAWFNQPGTVAPGWYRAHTDPVVGRALRLLQQDPVRAWTVAGLAAESGASRSALARSFTDLVGVPPMTYLKQWRLARAADLLLAQDLTLDAFDSLMSRPDTIVRRAWRGRSLIGVGDERLKSHLGVGTAHGVQPPPVREQREQGAVASFGHLAAPLGVENREVAGRRDAGQRVWQVFEGDGSAELVSHPVGRDIELQRPDRGQDGGGVAAQIGS